MKCVPILPSIGTNVRNIRGDHSLILLPLNPARPVTNSAIYWYECEEYYQRRPLNHSLTLPPLNPVYSLTNSTIYWREHAEYYQKGPLNYSLLLLLNPVFSVTNNAIY